MQRPPARNILAVLVSLVAVAALAVSLSASTGAPRQVPTVSTPEAGQRVTRPAGSADRPPRGVVNLAFAGDIHFALHLSDLLDRPGSALGGVTRTLRAADLTMVNLETSITTRGTEEPKDYHFRTSPLALDVLDRAGVDVIGLANNHSVDYGPVGLADTLRAARRSPAPVVGIGGNAREAYRPHRVSVRGTDIAFFAANTKRERTSRRWAAGPGTPGIATAVEGRPRRLLSAVRAASRRDDVVVVYLHWGTESESCPGPKQRVLARALAGAGADVVVGSHAHELQGSGWMGDTYVSYGLGNFVWYHNQRSESGVLKVRVVDGEVAGGSLVPARIETDGRPRVLTGTDARAAVTDWRSLRGCSGLSAGAG